MLKSMEGQSRLSELSVISWVSAIQGCPFSGVPLYSIDTLCSMMYTAYHKRLLIRVLCSNCARGMSSLKTSSLVIVHWLFFV